MSINNIGSNDKDINNIACKWFAAKIYVTNSIVYFEKNEFNYNVRKNKDINTHVRLRIIWKKRYFDNMPVGCLQIYQIENDMILST